MAKNVAVFGIYRDRLSAEEAVDALRAGGYRNSDVSALLPENLGTKDLAHEKNTKAPEGIATGAASGGILGGALGWLAGIGALAIPGLGPLIAVGPIVGALSGVGAGGAVGGLIGGLWAWGFRSTKPSASRVVYAKVASCFQSIATIRLGEAREGDSEGDGRGRYRRHRRGERRFRRERQTGDACIAQRRPDTMKAMLRA